MSKDQGNTTAPEGVTQNTFRCSAAASQRSWEVLRDPAPPHLTAGGGPDFHPTTTPLTWQVGHRAPHSYSVQFSREPGRAEFRKRGNICITSWWGDSEAGAKPRGPRGKGSGLSTAAVEQVQSKAESPDHTCSSYTRSPGPGRVWGKYQQAHSGQQPRDGSIPSLCFTHGPLPLKEQRLLPRGVRAGPAAPPVPSTSHRGHPPPGSIAHTTSLGSPQVPRINPCHLPHLMAPQDVPSGPRNTCLSPRLPFLPWSPGTPCSARSTVPLVGHLSLIRGPVHIPQFSAPSLLSSCTGQDGPMLFLFVVSVPPPPPGSPQGLRTWRSSSRCSHPVYNSSGP